MPGRTTAAGRGVSITKSKSSAGRLEEGKGIVATSGKAKLMALRKLAAEVLKSGELLVPRESKSDGEEATPSTMEVFKAAIAAARRWPVAAIVDGIVETAITRAQLGDRRQLLESLEESRNHEAKLHEELDELAVKCARLESSEAKALSALEMAKAENERISKERSDMQEEIRVARAAIHDLRVAAAQAKAMADRAKDSAFLGLQRASERAKAEVDLMNEKMRRDSERAMRAIETADSNVEMLQKKLTIVVAENEQLKDMAQSATRALKEHLVTHKGIDEELRMERSAHEETKAKLMEELAVEMSQKQKAETDLASAVIELAEARARIHETRDRYVEEAVAEYKEELGEAEQRALKEMQRAEGAEESLDVALGNIERLKEEKQSAVTALEEARAELEDTAFKLKEASKRNARLAAKMRGRIAKKGWWDKLPQHVRLSRSLYGSLVELEDSRGGGRSAREGSPVVAADGSSPRRLRLRNRVGSFYRAQGLQDVAGPSAASLVHAKGSAEAVAKSGNDRNHGHGDGRSSTTDLVAKRAPKLGRAKREESKFSPTSSGWKPSGAPIINKSATSAEDRKVALSKLAAEAERLRKRSAKSGRISSSFLLVTSARL